MNTGFGASGSYHVIEVVSLVPIDDITMVPQGQIGQIWSLNDETAPS